MILFLSRLEMYQKSKKSLWLHAGSSKPLNIDSLLVAPAFLVEAESYTKGCKKVIHFLNETALVKSGINCLFFLYSIVTTYI